MKFCLSGRTVALITLSSLVLFIIFNLRSLRTMAQQSADGAIGMLHPSFSATSTLKKPESDPLVKRNGGNVGLTTILSLPSFVDSMDINHPFLQLFNRIFVTEAKSARLRVPPSFEAKVRAMFSKYPGGTESLKFIEHQTIVSTYNRFTDEYSLFNEVRRFRPGYMEKLGVESEEAVERMIASTAGANQCDFCNGERTAVDIFGKLEGKYCYVAANVAKYEQWHSLIVSKVHHPLNVTAEMLVDYLATANRWFRAVHSEDPEAIYPHIMWDAGSKASASQVHQHLQMSLTHDRYFTHAENTKLAAIDYERMYAGRNYWQDVVSVHDFLGLAVRHGRSVALSHLAPIKEREVIIVGESASDPSFAELIGVTIQALRDDVGTRAFSMAILLQPLGTAPREGAAAAHFQRNARVRHASIPLGDGVRELSDVEREVRLMRSYPALARIVDRGSPLDARSDVGAMEFYGANNVGADPFDIVPHLRNRLVQLQDRNARSAHQ